MLLSHSTPEGHVAPECKPDSFLQRWRNVGLWGEGVPCLASRGSIQLGWRDNSQCCLLASLLTSES